MTPIQEQAAEALRDIAAHEHKFLAEGGKKDGFELSVLDTSTVTDAVFEAWFSLKLKGKTVYFTFSLGYDADTSRYSPTVDVTGGDDKDPTEFDNRVIAAAPVTERELLDAVELLGREAGEARVKAFQWLETITNTNLRNTMTTNYITLVDGREYDRDSDEAAILARAKAFFEQQSPATPMTVCVVKNFEELLSWTSNRRILGSFTKQVWGGRKNDNAVDVGTEEFDATDMVLLMPLEQIAELEDCSENTDSLGNQLVQWDGPCSVRVTDSLLAFFGVLDGDDITEAHLKLAREAVQPSPQEEAVLTLTIKVKATKSKGRTWDEVISELDYSVRSTTPGAIVLDTEVIDSNVVLSHVLRG